MDPIPGARLLEALQRKCWEGPVSPLRTRRDFNCWVCVCSFCRCCHRSTQVFHRHCMWASPGGAVSCAVTCPWCVVCSVMLPSGHKTRWVCLAGLLLFFPSPNLCVVRNLYIMEDTLYFRYCTLYLRSSKSLYCAEDKVMLCWRTYRT